MPLRVEERVVSGRGRADEVVVHHLSLRGANRQVGRHLAELVRGRYGVPAEAVPADPSERAWLAAHAAPLLERARGAAPDAAPGEAPALARLGAPALARGAAAFVPAAIAGEGRPLLARVVEGPDGPPGPGTLPASRPYILELHPDEGLPSLALVAFDLLGGVLDGVNAAGLGVVVAPGEHSAAGRGTSLDALQLARVVLDGCATAEAARDLLSAASPAAGDAVWIVADRAGGVYVIEQGAGPPRVHAPGACDAPVLLTDRALRALRSALAPGAGPWTPATLDAAWSRALETERRTLWRGVYDLAARALLVRFPEGEGMTAGLRFELQA